MFLVTETRPPLVHKQEKGYNTRRGINSSHAYKNCKTNCYLSLILLARQKDAYCISESQENGTTTFEMHSNTWTLHKTRRACLKYCVCFFLLDFFLTPKGKSIVQSYVLKGFLQCKMVNFCTKSLELLAILFFKVVEYY